MTKRRRINEKPDSKPMKKRTLLNHSESLSPGSIDNLRNGQLKSLSKGKGSIPIPGLPPLRSVWLFSCWLRIAWTLYGQSGYIHPDEFFQGPEVVAGDVFGIKVRFLVDRQKDHQPDLKTGIEEEANLHLYKTHPC